MSVKRIDFTRSISIEIERNPKAFPQTVEISIITKRGLLSLAFGLSALKMKRNPKNGDFY